MLARRGALLVVLLVVLAILAGLCDRLPDDRQVVVGQDHPVARRDVAGLRAEGRADPERQAVRPGFW
ncbi:MAG TPA: hypothetical protein VGH88_21145 [Streptosporangiaceae bacterium]